MCEKMDMYNKIVKSMRKHEECEKSVHEKEREKKWCEKKWEVGEKMRCVRKSEKIVQKILICEENVREVCEKLRGMGKSEIWENAREKCDKCKKKLEVLKNKMCEKKCTLACLLGSLYEYRISFLNFD